MEVYGFSVEKCDEGKSMIIKQVNPDAEFDTIMLSEQEAILLANWILKEVGDNAKG